MKQAALAFIGLPRLRIDRVVLASQVAPDLRPLRRRHDPFGEGFSC